MQFFSFCRQIQPSLCVNSILRAPTTHIKITTHDLKITTPDHLLAIGSLSFALDSIEPYR